MQNPFVYSAGGADAWLRQAFTHHQQGQLAKARALYEQVLRLQPKHAHALYLLGTLGLQLRDLRMAERTLGRAAEVNPHHAPTLINLAMVLSQLDSHAKALETIERALRLEPASAAARSAHVGMLVRASRSTEALQEIDALFASGVTSAELWVNKGIAHVELDALDLAEQSFDQALALAPQHRDAQSQKVKLLLKRKAYEDALELADRQIAAAPGDPQANANRGHALVEMRRYVDAVEAYERACALEVTVERLTKLATALCLAELLPQAEAAVLKARDLDPDYPPLWVAAGQVLAALGEHARAVHNYDRFLEVRGNAEKVLLLKATSLIESRAYSAARDTLALCEDTDQDDVLSFMVYAKLMVADWHELDARIETLLSNVKAERGSYAPFGLLPVADDAALMRNVGRAWAQATHTNVAGQTGVTQQRARKLRIGYFSADFHEHATCMLMAEVLASHDRDRFELVGFSFGPTKRDTMTERVAQSFDHFLYVKEWTNERIVAQARQFELDIAVDLKGYTQHGRPALFAKGCAPIQVSYLGYPGTLGSASMDYIVADHTVIPLEHEAYFSEKVVRMPYSYQCNDSRRAIAAADFSRDEFGLPESGFVFVCFNNTYKILPEMFARWMRILQSVPDSVLWLYQGTEGCVDNLRSNAEAAGVSPERLVFAPHLPAEQHLARLSHADLFLDTLPCNAHTTASDALWAGVPLLTCIGQAFQGRVAASLLRALSLDELVTSNMDAYEAEAIALARSPQRLAELRAKLATQRFASPLFDGRRFARHLEAAYVTMAERHYAGLPPISFDVMDSDPVSSDGAVGTVA